jgi:spermidine dehydrogenase
MKVTAGSIRQEHVSLWRAADGLRSASSPTCRRTFARRYEEFQYAPALIANVALHNWRFLYRLGAPAVRWMDDGSMFGYCANIRRNMVVGDYNPPLHPDKPTLLTFYMGLYTPGHTAYQQGVLGRMRLLSTSYVEYE